MQTPWATVPQSNKVRIVTFWSSNPCYTLTQPLDIKPRSSQASALNPFLLKKHRDYSRFPQFDRSPGGTFPTLLQGWSHPTEVHAEGPAPVSNRVSRQIRFSRTGPQGKFSKVAGDRTGRHTTSSSPSLLLDQLRLRRRKRLFAIESICSLQPAAINASHFGYGYEA